MNVLLVDDQERILRAMEKLVNWEKLGIKQVFTADGAAAARKILDTCHIDIMLTDIEMPGEDGISLQKWQVRKYPCILCVFLTSHADFSYAREAIHNGAFDYILQPASIEDVEEVIRRCIIHLEARKDILAKNGLYEEKMSGMLESYVVQMFYQKEQFTQMENWRQASGTEGSNWWYLPGILEIEPGTENEVEAVLKRALSKVCFGENEICCTAGLLEDGNFGVLFYGKSEENNSGFGVMELSLMKEGLNFVRQQLGEELDRTVTMFLGKYAGEDLPEQIALVSEYQSKMVVKKDAVYLADRKKAQELKLPDAASWGKWLIRKDWPLVKNQIVNLLRYAERERYLTVSYMQKILHSFLEACSIACYAQNKTLADLFTRSFTYEKMLHSCSSVEELCRGVDFCLRQYQEILSEKGEDENSYSAKERIEDILHYLDENMDRMITRREAAKYVFLNEDYFSRMFRKEMGVGYKEYVLKQKMDYAEKLLENTDMPVTLIASKVGYENFTNFTQMFRKYSGETPTEYRKRNKKEGQAAT